MLEPLEILDHSARLLVGGTPLRGRQVLVSAGPSREAIDPVRFVGNRSSGRMGFAIAAAAWRRGAEVTLVTGPSALATPTGVRRLDVESAEEMLAALAAEIVTAELFVMAAAVADFRPDRVAGEKIKKAAGPPRIALTPTPDILRETRGLRPPGCVVVGFALETEAPLENARRKLEGKELDLVVLNDAREPGAGFEVATNRVTFLDRQGHIEEMPLLAKEEVADRLLDRVAPLLPARRP